MAWVMENTVQMFVNDYVLHLSISHNWNLGEKTKNVYLE